MKPTTSPPTDKTLFLVLAEFGSAQIPLTACAHHFGLTEAEAKRAAPRQALPVPCYRLGSQKSPWLVAAEALAEHIRTKQQAANKEWQKVNSAA